MNKTEQERWLLRRVARLRQGEGGVTLAAFMARVDQLAEQAMARDDESGQVTLEALLDCAPSGAPGVP